uniref:Activating transcription factor 7 interacting protein 2 n=1 Tax=Nothobranchius korthausae TaxID=1143690 RepID=A0A1A8HAX2_9TELE
MSDEDEARGDSPSGGTAKRLKRSHRAERSSERCWVNIGVAFQSWRSARKARGLPTDEAAALFLLDEGKKNASQPNGAGNGKIRVSKSQLQELIQHEVCTAEANNEAKMRHLIEAVELMKDDTSIETSFQQMEAHINLMSKRVDVALAYLKKTQDQSLTSAHADADRIRGDPDDEATEILELSDAEKSKCIIKIEETVELMKTAKCMLEEVKAKKEESTGAMVEFTPEKAPPTLSPNSSWMETNQGEKYICWPSDEFSEKESSPPTLTPMMSSEQMVPTGDLKRELEDSQDEKKIIEQPEDKKFKQEDMLRPPSLPANPFPSTLSMEAALYSLPQKVELNLALIRNPTRLSVLWNVVKVDPAAPPMDSYIIFLTMEKDKGSGEFSKWYSYDTLKATSLPMCALIKKYKPGHKVCAAVVGKDIFGRYGPYSEVVTATIPD